MTNVIDKGHGLVQAAGHEVRKGLSTVAPGNHRTETGANVQHGKSAAHEAEKSAFETHLIELAASVVGTLAAFFASRLIRARLHRHGR
jgi:hypothetical protein